MFTVHTVHVLCFVHGAQRSVRLQEVALTQAVGTTTARRACAGEDRARTRAHLHHEGAIEVCQWGFERTVRRRRTMGNPRLLPQPRQATAGSLGNRLSQDPASEHMDQSSF